jgi:DNA-binding transcriptional ArsR family regulator
LHQERYKYQKIEIRKTGTVFVNLMRGNNADFKNIAMRKQKTETVVLTKGDQDVQLDYAELRKAVLVLRAVNHKLRQRIISLLEENNSMNVTDIFIKLRLEQSVASQHLAILRRAGIVYTERSGKFIHYHLNKDRLMQISRLVEELLA